MVPYFTAKTLDDLMHPVLNRLLHTRNRVEASRGPCREVTGVLLRLSNPRARLSRSITRGKVFSALGEFVWYLSGSKELAPMTYYVPRYSENSDDGITVYGAYGPRLFRMHDGIDQIANVVALLKSKRSSRRAVIQLFDAADLCGKRKAEIPCTCALQFMVRHDRLEMVTFMRSNDVVLGLPHDVFSFTMLQEMIARSLDIDVGPYKHAVGSLHLYEDDFDDARAYLDEGFQATVSPMPEMPVGDPWPEAQRLVAMEKRIRAGESLPHDEISRPGYWSDLIRMLEVLRLSRTKQRAQITHVKRLMSSKVFNTYIERRELPAVARAEAQQLDLFSIAPPASSART